jgi:hypothetical protein
MNRKYKIYLDTSVIGGCFDAEFSKWSNLLFEDIIKGNFISYISFLTLDELRFAPEKVRKNLETIPQEILTPKSKEDSLHIAAAIVYYLDVIVSWNFKHIVNFDKIRKYNAVNALQGYNVIEN